MNPGEIVLTREERHALMRLIVLRGLYPGECTPARRDAIVALQKRGFAKLTYGEQQGDENRWTFAQPTDAGRAFLRQKR